MDTLMCPKCGGEMDEGFRIDKGHAGCVMPEQWMPGAPQTSFWLGTKADPAKLRKVMTFCCRECGFLESYAVFPTANK